MQADQRPLRLAVQAAERVHGPLTRPVFLVTDNGPSFIAKRFQATLAGIEWAGRGMSVFSQVRIAYRTPTQLGLLERFHETLKYEEVYWHLYDDPADARQKLASYHERYNVARPHWALVAAERGQRPGSDPDTLRSVRERTHRQPALMVPVGRLVGRGPASGGSTPT